PGMQMSGRCTSAKRFQGEGFQKKWKQSAPPPGSSGFSCRMYSPLVGCSSFQTTRGTAAGLLARASSIRGTKNGVVCVRSRASKLAYRTRAQKSPAKNANVTARKIAEGPAAGSWRLALPAHDRSILLAMGVDDCGGARSFQITQLDRN